MTSAVQERVTSCQRCGTAIEPHGLRHYCRSCVRERRSERLHRLSAEGGTRRRCRRCGEIREAHEYPLPASRACYACRGVDPDTTDPVPREWLGYNNGLTADERASYAGSTCASCMMLRACQVAVRAGEPVACEVA